MLRKALAVVGVALGFVFAVSAEALAQPTITIQSATLVDDRHVLVTGTATCTSGTSYTLGAFVLQQTRNEPRDGFGSVAGTCPSDGALTWSVTVEGIGAGHPYWRPGRAFVRATIIECTTLCTSATAERDLIVRPG
jgi:hypothetical protein